ncbi:MAG: 3-hydroxyacyl-CoA dehydrogenase family protein [Chloroflexi bacterium]|nr:3-hydroxyacyl-CoA dehydrogenase family protein [Chloroflexota bacterium]
MSINRIAVLGAGTMGHSIAQMAATSGFDVSLYDVSQEFLDKALAKITGNVEKFLVAKGKISAEDGQAALARLRVSTDLESAVKDTDFVIEAIPEKLDLKQKTFADLDRFCPAHTIFATNTSVKLVEVVLPLGVSAETVETTLAVCQQLGKTPIKCKDLPGFIVNRLLGRLYQEAAQMVLDGVATPEEIDTAMKLGAGYPMGPCELADFGGFDVIQMAQDAIHEYTGLESDRLSIMYRKMLEAGRLGRKNGKGFYDYQPDGSKTPFKIF